MYTYFDALNKAPPLKASRRLMQKWRRGASPHHSGREACRPFVQYNGAVVAIVETGQYN